MATTTETVVLKLDNQMTGPAAAAEGALARLEGQITREQAAIARLNASLRQAKGSLSAIAAGGEGGFVDVAAYRRQETAVARLADSIASKKDKIAVMTEKLRNGIPGAAERTKVPLAAVAKSMKLLGGEFGSTEAKGVKLVGLLLKMGPALGLVVASVVVLTLGLAALGGVLVKSIAGAEAMREEVQKLRVANVRWWDSNRANVSGALQLQNAINGVAVHTALAREKVVDYATQLRQARFTGKQLETALGAMATAGAAGGDALAGKFFEMAKAARYFGGDVDKLAKRVQDKFGDVANSKLLNIDVQLQKLHENIGFIFSGADIEPLLRALQSVLSFFNQDEAGAKALRSAVTKFTEAAIGGILRLTIFLLKSYIWLRTHETAWKGLKLVAIAVLGGIALGIAAVSAGVALLVAGVASLAAFFAAPLALIAVGIYKVVTGFNAIRDWFKTVDLSALGASMIEGLVNGIKNAGSQVVDALKTVVSNAVDGAAKFLHIRSPSKLMEDRIGFNMGAGIAPGIERAAPDVASAARGAVKGGVRAAGAAAGAGFSYATTVTPKASGGDSRPIEFNNCNFGGDLTESTMRKWIHVALDEDGMEAATNG